MIDIDFSIFRNNLRALVESRGIMVKDLAAEIGSVPATVSRYITGSRDPDLKYVVRLAEYFNVSIDWLLGLNGDKFDLLPEETQEIAELYSLASPSDRNVIQTILEKYRAENRNDIATSARIIKYNNKFKSQD